MRTITLPGEEVPGLGLGTRKMGVGDRDEAFPPPRSKQPLAIT